MAINPVEVEKTLYILIESSACRIVRTGLIGYYDPLPITDLFGMTLDELNTRDDTLPTTYDAIYDNLPDYVNAHKFDLVINQ